MVNKDVYKAWFPSLRNVTQRTVPQALGPYPFDKNVAKSIGNTRGSQRRFAAFRKQLKLCCIFPQVRKCRRRVGGIAVRCGSLCYGNEA